MHAALSILAALLARERTGEGSFLDVSTTEGVLYLMALQIDQYLATGEEASAGTTLLTGKYACYDVYPCRDGKWISVGAIEGAFWRNLCEALQLPELADKQYEDDAQDDVRIALRVAFARKSRDEWVDELAPKDTCVAPVLAVSEVAGHRQVEARGLIAEANRSDHGSFRQLGPLVAGSR
jgi:alpha-methylacyl-CoA racemase